MKKVVINEKISDNSYLMGIEDWDIIKNFIPITFVFYRIINIIIRRFNYFNLVFYISLSHNSSKILYNKNNYF